MFQFKLKNSWTIAMRDYKNYFNSPLAYLITAAFLFIMGWMFFYGLSNFNQQNMEYQQYNAGKAMSITDGIIKPLFGNMNVIFLFIIPFITMRLFAEERKNHTIQILLTAPVTLAEIVFGKFLSAALLVLSMMVLTLAYPAVLYYAGNPEWGPILTSFLGTFLLTSSLISVGVLFSATTENQIVAGILSFGAGLFLWLISWAAYSAGPVWNEVLMHLSLINHFNNFSQGMIQSVDVIYYLSFIFLGLFLTHRVLDSYRWR